MVTINGESISAEGKTLTEYINKAGFNIDRVVVELNLEIIPKERLSTTVLKTGDKVEILNFVGGG